MVALRIIPPELLAARRPHRMIERAVMVNRRTWLIIVSGFFEPLFYLLSIRIGFGELVGDVSVGGQTIPYDQFVAPALMAASAMNGAVYESTMNVYFKMKHAKLYDAVLSTPMVPADVALGEIGWAVTRGVLYSIAFLVTMWALGMVGSPWVVLAVPICVLIGSAFGAIGMALTTYMRSWADFEYVSAVTLPLFLFSATFYPVSSYGDWAWVVQLSPLYHGVALVRGVNLGEFEWAMLGHVAVLASLAVVGLVVAARRIQSLSAPVAWSSCSSAPRPRWCRRPTRSPGAPTRRCPSPTPTTSTVIRCRARGRRGTRPPCSDWAASGAPRSCSGSCPGVWSTAAGYAGGYTPNPTYEEVCSGRTGHAEVVLVVYDPAVVSYEQLLKAFWEDHDPSQGMRQGNDVGTQYRSAIYTADDEQRAAAEATKTSYGEALGEAGYGAITTEIVPLGDFYYAEPYHQQYLAKNPSGYCPIHATGVSCRV